MSAEVRRTGIARRANSALVERIGARALVIGHRAGKEPDDRIHDGERCGLAPAQHKIAQRYLFRGQIIGHSLVHVLVVTAQQREFVALGEALGIPLRKELSARREQHDRRSAA